MMDEKAASSGAQVEQSTAEQSPTALGQELASEHREAYGTAKTENLRDSGLWRILLPGFVAVSCLVLLAVPLIILIELFVESLDPTAAANQAHVSLTWLWIVMMLVELVIIAVIIRGLVGS